MRFRIKQSTILAKSTSPISLVVAMKNYILQAQPPASHPLFTFSQSGSWLTRSSLTKELWPFLQQCGFLPNNFHSPSFHIGAATYAASADILTWLIKVPGWWSSDCYELQLFQLRLSDKSFNLKDKT